MTKLKITQSYAKHSASKVIAVSYCFLQNVLKYESPLGYNSGRDGWNFDLYVLGSDYAIVTGYRGMSRSSNIDLLKYPELRVELEQLENLSYNDHSPNFKEVQKAKLLALLDKHLR